MSGPDLTNEVGGVLLRFLQEKVTFMADTATMLNK